MNSFDPYRELGVERIHAFVPSAAATHAAPGVSLLAPRDRLAEWAKFREEGMITAEEYATKRTGIIARV